MIGVHIKNLHLITLICALAALVADAEVLDRPSGIKIGERLTLRPYVSMSITYDSNVDANTQGTSFSGKKDDFLWTISPALWLHYNAETWSVILSGFYNYRQYFDHSHQNYNQHNFGEDLRWNWANSTGAEKGWSLILGESYQQITAADDLVLDGGQNYSNDAKQFQLAGAVQRRFNQYWHGDLNASYYWLKYDNNGERRYTFYGWDRILVGAEVGFAPSKWTDILISGSYQHYSQDNVEGSTISDTSQGYSLQGGFGSYMTDRISYRLLAGWSCFDYGDTSDSANGFVYTISGNWKIGETWNTMLLGSSYYQPSERQYSSRSRVDAISWGIAKVMVRGKLRATFDIRYRHETVESVTDSSWDYNLNIWTGRLGLDYTLCRFLAVFAYAEYQKSMNDEADRRNGAYDYDRWRISAGFRVQY